MKVMHVTTAVAWALTMLLLAPLEAKAGARGGGMRRLMLEASMFLEDTEL